MTNKHKNTFGLILLLLFFSFFMAMVVFYTHPDEFFAICTLVLGLILIIFHRMLGGGQYRLSQAVMSGSLAQMWRDFGERGVGYFYLGVGIILIIFGLLEFF